MFHIGERVHHTQNKNNRELHCKGITEVLIGREPFLTLDRSARLWDNHADIFQAETGQAAKIDEGVNKSSSYDVEQSIIIHVVAEP